MSVGIQFSRDRVVIAVDPHKGSWTATAVDASLQPLASIRVPVSRDGYRALRRFARRWPDAARAIEGATGIEAPLTRRLRADDIEVIDVPAKLATRVRVLSIGHGRKNDDADAVSVGIAALTSPTLNTAHIDTQATALRAIVDHRDDLVKIRTQTVNRLHVVLTHLVPGGPAARPTTPRPRRQDAARTGNRSHQRGTPARPPHRQGRQRYPDRGDRIGNRLDRPVWRRDLDRRKDPRPRR